MSRHYSLGSQELKAQRKTEHMDAHQGAVQFPKKFEKRYGSNFVII
jgi:hypothetical protein